jgi:hypothetical protein
MGRGNQTTALGYPCLDGIGRGQTVQSLNGPDFPGRLNSSTGTIAWPHQYLEPAYVFMNSIPGVTDTELNIRDTSTTQNVDVFIENPKFDGTTGTGFGLLSARPSTCTAGPGGTYYTSPTRSYGVAYWATDANGGQGELYVCTAANTWTAIYQPYPYPHPLAGGGTDGGIAGEGGAPNDGGAGGDAGSGSDAGGVAIDASLPDSGVGLEAEGGGNGAAPSCSGGCGCRTAT